MIDTQKYYAKLANNESLTQNEILDLLKELEHFRGSLAYLASCEAATLEGLPKSHSKRERERHVGMCEAAAAMLAGDGSKVRYPERLEAARLRCLRAAENNKRD